MKSKLIGAMARFAAAFALAFSAPSQAQDDEYGEEVEEVEVSAVDTYKLDLKLRIPRIYGNEKSLGKRKYQTQRVRGYMTMEYGPDGNLAYVRFHDMCNRTHRTSDGRNVTYPDSRLDDRVYPRFNAIGDNRTGRFKTASLCFFLAAEPSYNAGGFTEDNALYVVLSGTGKFHSRKKCLSRASGYASGFIGCGCAAYGHVSPTRAIGWAGPTGDVDDVAAVFGKWKIRLVQRQGSCLVIVR